MPRGQYTRKKAADAEPTDPAVADETGAAAVTEDPAGGPAPDAAAAADSNADDPAEPPQDPVGPATSANASDDVLYPVDDNPTAQPGPLCPKCFPAGWPAGAEQSVGCEHGMWLREWPPAGQDGH